MLIAEFSHLHDVFFWQDTAGGVHNFAILISQE